MSVQDLVSELFDLLPQQPAWSLETFANGHASQLAAMRADSNWLHFLCDRQSGKTWADMGVLLDNALARPGSLGVFLGLVGTGLKISVWAKWQLVTERFGVDCRHNQTEKLTTFANGSMVVFGGTDDLTNVRKYLGNRLADSVFIIDEAQDQKSAMLDYLLNNLLPPMMTPTTRVVLSGVLPDVPAGFFLDLATPDEKSGTGGKGEWAKWSHHSWGRLDNVHTPEAAEMLRRLEETKGVNDPQLLRDWKGVQRVWDPHATAYRYLRVKNAYRPVLASWCTPDMCAPGVMIATVPPKGIDMFAIGLDPAATCDRFAAVLWGWSSTARLGVWQVAEWVTARRANASETQWLAPVKLWTEQYRRYGAMTRVIRDAGSASTVNDVLWQSHAINIEPALKGPGSLRARVDRLSDLCDTGQAHIIEGSQLEEDLMKAKWDKDARAAGKYEWDSAHHPDVADAGSYGVVPFVETAPAPKKTDPRSDAQRLNDAADEAYRKRSEEAKAPPRLKPRDSAVIWTPRGRAW